jgi:hypothetical protein
MYPKACFILEFMEYGDIHNFIFDYGQKVTCHMFLKIAHDVACALKYLHGMFFFW